MTKYEHLISLDLEDLADELANITDCNYCPAEQFGCDNCKQAWVKYLESDNETA